jgi:PAS domain S-box-containing protein
LNTRYQRTLIALAILFAGTCVFLFNLFYREARNTAITKLHDEQMIHAKQAARGIEDFFATWTRSLSSLSKMDEIVDNAAAGQRYMKLFYEANQEQIMSITRLDERGVILHNFPSDSPVGTDISDQKHVRELLRDHKPVISDVFKAVEGPDAIALHVPVFRGSEFKGSIGILINFESLAKRYLDVIKIGETGYAWVVSRDGTILYSPIPGFTGKSAFETSKDFPSLTVMENDMVQGREGAAIYTFNRIGDRNVGQTTKYAVFMPIHIRNTFWSIAVTSAEQDVLSGLISFRNKLALVIGAIFICGMVFSTLGAKAWFIVKGEVKLRESEVRFRTMADTAPVLIWMAGTDKLCIYFNKGWLDFTGRSLEQELGNGWTERVHPEDLPECLKHYVESFDARRPFTMEYRLRRHDGEYRWISDTGVPRYDPERNFLGYIGSCVDLTERKRAEQALKESEHRFRQVAETAGEFIWEVDAEGLYTYASPTVEKILGYTPEELVGKKHFYDLFVPSVREELMATASRVNAARQSFRDFPNPNVSKSGKIVYLETSGAPVLDPAGNLTGYRGAAADVTGRKQSELELGQQRNELAHLSRVSTMGVLTSSLAHELNQPLTAILSNAQAGSRFLSAPTPDLAEVRGALEDIAQDAKRAGEVIRQMRALVRKDEPHLEPLDLNRVISDVVRLLHSDMLVRKVQIALELAPKLRPASGDNAQLQQVMLNLVLNAFDAMKDVPEGKRTVILRTRQLDAASIQVEVSDVGTGISPDQLVNLFEPFRSSKREGLGLGLSISRSIVEAHQGRIWAENNPDHGAIFYFTLPVHEPELNLT